MTSHKAFTLIELLVGIVVGLIIILTIGAISQISLSSHTKRIQQTNIEKDIVYGFRLIQDRVRNSDACEKKSPAGTWLSDQLRVTHKTYTPNHDIGGNLIYFCPIHTTFTSTNHLDTCPTCGRFVKQKFTVVVNESAFGVVSNNGLKKLVYVHAINAPSVQDIILSVPDTNPLDFVVTSTGGGYKVDVSGTKDKIPFQSTTLVTRRMP